MKFKNNIKFGRWGEEKASKYLSAKGYKILENNYRLKFGEIDIIAGKDDLIVFIEVKTRSNIDYGFPQAAVTTTKQEKIKKTAQFFLHESNYHDYQIRFDVISILYQNEVIKIEHLKNCF